jgi:seryl-tRNA synthetase
MIDIKLIRENPELVITAHGRKGIDSSGEISEILKLDIKRREILSENEADKAEQNKTSKQIPQIKKSGGDVTEVVSKLSVLKEKIQESEQQLREVETQLNELMLRIPNIPDEDIPSGGKENNKVLRTYGEPPVFDFEPKHHIDLCTDLGLIDYPLGVKLSGSGYWAYRGLGARLEWALLNYFIDTHIEDGYEFIMVPHILEYESGLTAGQFPKFADEVFKIANPTDDRMRYLLPTAEAALVSVYRNEIVPESELPKKLISYTPCYRREAGSHRAEERGMIRGHQFNKVEMVQYTTPEGSAQAHEELVYKAEKLVTELGFHYKTVMLAAGDCSDVMSRTYDIEIYIPSMNGYKEVSSVSNARCFQARRGMMRTKREDGKIEYMHVLNGSGLATSRLIPALVEQNQQKDGTVVIPGVLRKYLGGLETIG